MIVTVVQTKSAKPIILRTIAPTITSISPNNGIAGQPCVITGSNFTDIEAVTFGGVAATVTAITSTQIFVTAPTHSSGAIDVVVIAGGGFTRAAGGFTYTALAPVVSSTDKIYGAHTGGAQVTITGLHFTGATSAAYGGVNLTSFLVVNDTTITGVTGAHAIGAVDITVTGPGGTGTLPASFTYVNPTSIFGPNLKRWYSTTYNAGTGVWTDQSGNANTTSTATTPTATTLPNGHAALDFGGASVLNIGTNADLFTDVTGACVACIFQTPSLGVAQLLCKAFASAEWWLGYDVLTPSSGRLTWGIGADAGSPMAFTDASVSDGLVHRVIGTAAPGTNGTILYLDGVAQTTTGTAVAPSGTDTNAIGGEADSAFATPSGSYSGLLAEVVIVNITPSSTQRSQLDAYLRDCAGQAS